MLRHDERLAAAKCYCASYCSTGLPTFVRTFGLFDVHLLLFERKRLLSTE
jgi:hypothetical protein